MKVTDRIVLKVSSPAEALAFTGPLFELGFYVEYWAFGTYTIQDGTTQDAYQFTGETMVDVGMQRVYHDGSILKMVGTSELYVVGIIPDD